MCVAGCGDRRTVGPAGAGAVQSPAPPAAELVTTGWAAAAELVTTRGGRLNKILVSIGIGIGKPNSDWVGWEYFGIRVEEL